MVRGQPKHVVGYLKEFLFSEAQARAPVRSLSGGEKARLILAGIMARQSNLLVLDEPTNDLDVETLDLLQELLGEYDGTVILVSHDRDFLDRVAATTIVMEGDGNATICAGGWTDSRVQMGLSKDPLATKPAKSKGANKDKSKQKVAETGLTYVQTHRLTVLPDEIARLEAEITKLEGVLSDADLFTREPKKFATISDALVERHNKLSDCEEEWMMLEEKAGG